MSFFSHSRKKSTASTINGSPKKRDTSSRSFDIQVTVPTIKESSFGDSIASRTTSVTRFRDLGPPDLVHLSKYSKHIQKDEGEYHFVTGVDVSSSAGPLAYFTSCSLNHAWIQSKHQSIFTYCSYNAFSKADLRIRTEYEKNRTLDPTFQLIPADRNQRILSEITPDQWEELFISGVVRSVIINIETDRKLPTLSENIQFQTISSLKDTIKRLVKFLDRGAELGANENVQYPSIYENYLVDTLLILVDISGLYDYTIGLIEQSKNSKKYEILIVKLLIKNDQEIKAVHKMNEVLKQNHRNSLVLIEQIKFLISKSNFKIANQIALHSVKVNPIAFTPWYYLIKTHILLDDFHSALTALNSAPMSNPRNKDIININEKDEIFLPLPSTGKVESVWKDDLIQVFGPNSETQIPFASKANIEAIDPALLRINIKGRLKGTHSKAYELLIIIVNKIGWERLLKIRAQVFLMDDEYQNSSVLSLVSKSSASIRTKRVCEKWLDELFLQLYEDLRVVLIVENELAKENSLKHSALEWELIGLTALRTAHYRSAVSALRTTIAAKFDIISATRLLELWFNQKFDTEFQLFHTNNKFSDIDISLDDILKFLLQVISYNIRFYNEAQLETVLFLRKLFTKFDVDYIKNKVQVLFENDNNDFSNSGVIPSFDRLSLSVYIA